MDSPVGRGVCLRKLKMKRAEFDAFVRPMLKDGRVIETLPTRNGGAPGYCTPTCTKRPPPLWVFILYDIRTNGLSYNGLMSKTGKRCHYIHDVVDMLVAKEYLSKQGDVCSVTKLGEKAIDGPYDFSMEPEYHMPEDMRAGQKEECSPEYTAHKLVMDVMHNAIRVARKENR